MSQSLKGRWKYPWQVVRLFRNGSIIVTCSHRWEATADACRLLRDRVDRNSRVVCHDTRRTP